MRFPRNVSGSEVLSALKNFGYTVVRKSGSHIRLTHQGPPEHHITVPIHKEMKIGTLNAILTEVSDHLKISKYDILK